MIRWLTSKLCGDEPFHLDIVFIDESRMTAGLIAVDVIGIVVDRDGATFLLPWKTIDHIKIIEE